MVVLAGKKEYLESISVIPIISFAFVLRGMQYMFSLSFHYSKRTTLNAVIVIIAAIVNVILNIYLVNKFNFIGAAYSMFVSTLVMMWLSYIFGQKVYHINYELRKLFILIIAGIAFYYISIYLSNFNIFWSLLSKLALFIIFPFILVPFKFYEKVEIKRIQGAWVKWRNPLKWNKNLRQFKF